MLHRRFLLIFIGVFLFLSFAIPIEAATGIHEVINFQGKVVNSDGTNVTDGTYDFVIKLYDSAGSGGATLFTESWTSAALWSSTMSSAPASAGESLTYSSNTNESTIKAGQLLWNTTKQEVVTVETVNTTTNVITISPTRQAWAISDTVTNKIYVKDGVFIIPINALNADLSAVNFNTDNIYVGTNFNADGEMKPRIRFKTVPYAMNAAKVGGLTVTNTTGTFTLASGKTFTVNNTLTLQGTDSTTFTLPGTSDTLAGLASAQTLTNKTIGSTGLTFSGAATDIATASNEDFVIAPNGTGKVGLFSSASGGRFNVSNTGQSAIGKALGIFDQYESQDIFTASASGSTVFTVGRSNVTIADGKGIILGSTTNGIESTLTTNGAMYYSTSTSKFRCYQASAWTDCIGAGAGSGTVNSGISGFFSYYPSTGTTVDDQSVLYTNGANIGIGNTLPVEKLSVTGNATISGSLTLGNGSVLRPAYGPLFLQYKSAPNTWATGLTIQDTSGNVGIGTTSPNSRFVVSQTNITPATFTTTSSISNSVSGNNASYASAVDMYVTSTNGLTGAGGNDVYGLYSDLFATSDGSGQNIRGVFSQLDTQDSTDTGMAFHAKTRTSSTAGTQYGLYIEMDPTLTTTSYGIYQQTANKNYFKGNVGIGTNTPDAYLNVDDAGQLALGKALGIFDQYETQDILTASASGSTVFTVGRSNVTIADGKGFILGSTTNAIESTLTTNGAMYYSTSTSKFRCYQASAWTDCIGAGGGSGTVNSGTSGFFTYYPSTGTTVDDQSVLYTDGTNIGIGTQSTTAKLTVSGTASISGSLTVGNGSAIQPAYGPLVFNYKSGANAWTAGLTIEDSTGKITLGSASNGFIFNPASGPSFAGNARPTKMITLTPEYSGAVLTAFYGAGTDTNITGSMTSDTDTSGNLLRNYYQWSSSQVALHYYTVAVRVRLPKDFAAWSTSNAVQVDFATQSTAAASNVVDVRIYNGDDTPGTIVASSTGNASGVASTWTTITIDDSAIDDGGAPDWDAADETAVIYIRMGSLSSNVVKIGDIRLSYLSSF